MRNLLLQSAQIRLWTALMEGAVHRQRLQETRAQMMAHRLAKRPTPRALTARAMARALILELTTARISLWTATVTRLLPPEQRNRIR